MHSETGSPLQVIHRHSGDSARTEAFGAYRIEALVTEAEERAATFYRIRIEPGQRTGVSYHRLAEEYYFVLAGSGAAILNGKSYALSAGDFLRLPPGTTHGFVTADRPLEMLDIHTPGCRPNRDVYFVEEPPADGSGNPPTATIRRGQDP